MQQFINPLLSVELYAYHYTTTETALNYILRDGTIRLNSFSAMNDPRESKDWTILTMVRNTLNPTDNEWDSLSTDISSIFKRNTKLVCFSKDRKSAVNQWQPEALLDRGFTRPSMWHHYAGGHDGVCLMFNIEKLGAAFSRQVDPQQLVRGDVHYSDEGILPNIYRYPFSVDLTDFEDLSNLMEQPRFVDLINSHFSQWIKPLFFTKLRDWSNEEEMRFIYFDDNSQPITLKFDDALEGIIIGAGVSPHHKEDFLRYCVIYRSDITHLDWSNGYPVIQHPGQPYLTHKHLLQHQSE